MPSKLRSRLAPRPRTPTTRPPHLLAAIPRSLAGDGSDEREVARAVAAAGGVVALTGVEQVQAVQPRAGRADRMARERRSRALVDDAGGGCMLRDQCVERVRELVRLRLLRRTDPERRETACTREHAWVAEHDNGRARGCPRLDGGVHLVERRAERRLEVRAGAVEGG